MTDARVLDALGRELGVELGSGDVSGASAASCGALPATPSRHGPRAAVRRRPAPQPAAGRGQAVLATWHHLIDLGRLLDGDDDLAGTARPPVVRLSKATAAGLGVADGDAVTVSTERGAITLPAAVTDMPDGVVWLPTNSPGSTVRRTLGVPPARSSRWSGRSRRRGDQAR